MVDILFEESESQSVHYYCIATEHHRYDFAIIFTNNFFGKAMVVSIQSGTMVLMCNEDTENELLLGRKIRNPSN
ncbi:SAV0927 family protein [Peribacillus sp. V2I11]|uniref:SAV0927 family protein n=1 Tax=Peribacillus sp. V2I11 TaxID=3042277 RepID=UPI00277EEEC3|nr:SAV0927 family protein [Peribacillus sp. V2I11]MDQ0884577.1 hypothetical protein [Peribacillus sp. V2I11]